MCCRRAWCSGTRKRASQVSSTASSRLRWVAAQGPSRRPGERAVAANRRRSVDPAPHGGTRRGRGKTRCSLGPPRIGAALARLEDEYELVERSRATERKLALISETAGTLIELVHNQRSLRLEWYIIGLIGLELLLSLYGLVWGRLPLAAGSH